MAKSGIIMFFVALVGTIIAGVGALLGHLIAAGINSVVIGPEGASAMLESLGVSGIDYSAASSGPMYYMSGLLSGGCLGIMELVIMVGLGALGGFLWYQFTGKNSQISQPPQTTI